MSLAHLLDNYLDTIDYLPTDLNTAIAAIHARATEAADLHRTLTRRRTLYLRSPDSSSQDQLFKKISKERQRLEEVLKEKMELEEQVRRAASRQLARLDAVLRKQNAQVGLHPGHVGVVDDVPWADLVCSTCHGVSTDDPSIKLEQCSNCQVHYHANCNHNCKPTSSSK